MYMCVCVVCVCFVAVRASTSAISNVTAGTSVSTMSGDRGRKPSCGQTNKTNVDQVIPTCS